MIKKGSATRFIYDFLKANDLTEEKLNTENVGVTAADIYETLKDEHPEVKSIKGVNASVTFGLIDAKRDKHYAKRIKRTVETEDAGETEVQFIVLTEKGMELDPDAKDENEEVAE